MFLLDNDLGLKLGVRSQVSEVSTISLPRPPCLTNF